MILDTHAWVQCVTDTKLGGEAGRRIKRAHALGQLRVAAVSLFEIALLVQARRLRFHVPVAEWFRGALGRAGISVVALDAAIAIHAARLMPSLRDPADCQIVATALDLGAPVATRDTRILEHAKTLGFDVVEL